MLKPKNVPKTMQLFETHLAIEETPAMESGQLGFIARVLAQAGLPYTDLGPDVKVYERTNGRLTLRLVSHAGIPYGTIPRILLAFVSTEVIRTKSQTVHIGRNVSSFLRDKLHLTVTGGKRGNIGRVKLQAYKLFSSQFSITRGYESETPGVGRAKERYMNLSEEIDLTWWAANEDEDSEAVWESDIKLSPQFYKEVTQSPVPVDWRAVSVLKGSALALDIYFWLTHRMKYLKDTTRIPWFGEYGLFEQFGSDCENDHKGRYTFRRNATAALQQVLSVYPDAKVESTPDGLILRPSPTHIMTFPAAVLPAEIPPSDSAHVNS